MISALTKTFLSSPWCLKCTPQGMCTLLSEMLPEVDQLFALNVIVNLLALLFPILEVLCSDLCLEDGYHEGGLHHFPGRNFKMVPLVKP